MPLWRMVWCLFGMWYVHFWQPHLEPCASLTHGLFDKRCGDIGQMTLPTLIVSKLRFVSVMASNF